MNTQIVRYAASVCWLVHLLLVSPNNSRHGNGTLSDLHFELLLGCSLKPTILWMIVSLWTLPQLLLCCRSSSGWNNGIHVFSDLKLRVQQMILCLLWNDIPLSSNTQIFRLGILLEIIEKPDWAKKILELIIIEIKWTMSQKIFRSCGRRNENNQVHPNKRCVLRLIGINILQLMGILSHLSFVFDSPIYYCINLFGRIIWFYVHNWRYSVHFILIYWHVPGLFTVSSGFCGNTNRNLKDYRWSRIISDSLCYFTASFYPI